MAPEIVFSSFIALLDNIGKLLAQLGVVFMFGNVEGQVLPRPTVPCPEDLRWRGAWAPDLQLTSDLRQAARGLDAKAADFEDVELYGEADRLRQLARRLRMTARGLSESVSPVHPPEAARLPPHLVPSR